MSTDQVLALIGAALLAFVIRVFNVVVEWLARVMRVQPPEPIPTARPRIGDTDRGTPSSPQPGDDPAT